ncbi:hypothetical protein ACTXT7_008849 [Hymenolepis weldensis]
MNLSDFSVTKVLGAGKFSVIYEAICTSGRYKDTRFAIKRFFFRTCSSVVFILHEREIFERLMDGNSTSPFVSTLFWAIGGHETPCLITTLGSGYDLYDLIASNGPLSEEDARFYIAEIMCGLEYIHRKGIVHGDIKPENALLSVTGHILIMDFDQSWDLTNPTTIQKTIKHVGTYDYMAPEVAKDNIITTKADTWCLGSTMVSLISPPFRPDNADEATIIQMAKEGKYNKLKVAFLPKNLMEFLNACLLADFNLRPEITDLRYLKFFHGINWEKLGACQAEPPVKLSNLKFVSSSDFSIDPTSPLLRNSISGSKMPDLHATYRTPFPSALQYIPFDSEFNITKESMEKYFIDYNFTNPLIKEDKTGRTD